MSKDCRRDLIVPDGKLLLKRRNRRRNWDTPSLCLSYFPIVHELAISNRQYITSRKEVYDIYLVYIIHYRRVETNSNHQPYSSLAHANRLPYLYLAYATSSRLLLAKAETL